MKANRLLFITFGLFFTMSSCFDDPGVDAIFSETFVELDAAGTASGEREYVYERQDDGVNVSSGFQVLLSSVPLDQAVTVNFQIDESSTATEGTHFVVTSNTVTIPAGENIAELPIDIIDDNIGPDQELDIDITITSSSIDVSSNLSSATHVISIFVPQLFFATAEASGLESAGSDSVMVILDIPASVNVPDGTTFTFDYTAGGSATATDFTITSMGPFTIPVSSGLRDTTMIYFDLLDDVIIEEMDSILFGLSNASFSSGQTIFIGLQDNMTYEIEDDLKSVGFADTDTLKITSLNQANLNNLAVSLSRPSPNVTTVDYTINGNGAYFNDITGGSINFEARQTEEFITLEILEEALTVNTDTLDIEVILESFTTVDNELELATDTLKVIRVIPVED